MIVLGLLATVARERELQELYLRAVVEKSFK